MKTYASGVQFTQDEILAEIARHEERVRNDPKLKAAIDAQLKGIQDRIDTDCINVLRAAHNKPPEPKPSASL